MGSYLYCELAQEMLHLLGEPFVELIRLLLLKFINIGSSGICDFGI